MSSYEALTRSERTLPMVLVANVAPFLFGVLIVATTLEYQADDIAHWGLENYLGFGIAAYLPFALAALAILQLKAVPENIRRIAQQFLLGWGTINLLVFAVYLLAIWPFL